MRFSSSLSIAASASHPTSVTTSSTSTTLTQSDTSTTESRSDSGSDAGSHRGDDARSIIRKHMSFRPRSESPSSRRKAHLLALSSPSTDHVNNSPSEATAKSFSNPLLKFKSRSRGQSGSSLLNPTIKISSVSSVSRENLPQRLTQIASTAGILTPGPADSSNLIPAPHHHQQLPSSVVDQSFIAVTTVSLSFPSIFSTCTSRGTTKVSIRPSRYLRLSVSFMIAIVEPGHRGSDTLARYQKILRHRIRS